MRYTQAVQYLQHLCAFGINPGMSRITQLLAMLGNPEGSLKCIHVAGTNGKGSTSMLMAEVLRCQGYKVGVYTSPHLQTYRERIVVDGVMISEADFARLVQMMRPFLTEVLRRTGDHPTEFEALTAMAFRHFYEQGVDFAIVEVGLGGLLDSTNIITPLVAVITNVSFDHMDRLGTSLREIAGQKAGIIKGHVPVVTAAQGDALAVIKERAAAVTAPLVDIWQTCRWHLVLADPAGQTFHVETSRGRYENLRISLLGPHQLINSAVALAALEELVAQGAVIDRQAIYQGFFRARWPGRCEIIAQTPLIILDGAHNPDGARALRATFEALFSRCETVFVVGVLADKDYRVMCAEFSAVANVMILTTADSPRAADPFVLAEAVSGCDTIVIPDLREAIATGVCMAETGKTLCICGSLYTIGRARDILLGTDDNIVGQPVGT